MSVMVVLIVDTDSFKLITPKEREENKIPARVGAAFCGSCYGRNIFELSKIEERIYRERCHGAEPIGQQSLAGVEKMEEIDVIFESKCANPLCGQEVVFIVKAECYFLRKKE
jgi:hypothetical protein